jgi:tripartite ATP-independent transporter DctM subunit
MMCKRNPLLGPRGPATRFTEKVVSLKSTWGVLALFGLVMGGLYAGIFTPTEAGGIGAFGAFIFAISKRGLNWSNFKESLSDGGKIAAMGFLILIGAMILGYFLAASRLPFELASAVSELPVNRYIIMTIILLLYIALGCVMSVLALIILTVPIFFPLIVALGFDPIWFGVIIVRVVEMGQITPPIGINVYAIKGVAKDVPLNTIFRGIVPFLMADIFQVVLLVAFPQIVLFLPSLLK